MVLVENRWGFGLPYLMPMLDDSLGAINYRAAKNATLARPDATSCGSTNSLHVEQLQGS